MITSLMQFWRWLTGPAMLQLQAWWHIHCRPRDRRGKPLKIALSMGTFNPIHLWHLQVAQCAWDQYRPDFVLFIPNGDPPHKEGVVNKWLRYRMVKAGIRGNKAFKVSRIEVIREGKSFTADTMKALKALYGPDTELCLIIGLDNVDSIKGWVRPEEIFKMAKLLIAPRNSKECTREAIAQALPPGVEFDIIDSPDSNVSSTMIRDWIRLGRIASAAYLVPNAVRRIIEKYRLYRS